MPTLATSKLVDAHWLIPFADAAARVIHTMLSSGCVVGDPIPATHGHQMYQVTACIGMSGDVSGALSFSTSSQSAIEITRRMTGVECESVDDLVRDGMGEMANMIAGAGKSEIESVSMSLGLPQVILGEAYTVYSPRWSRQFFVPLDTDFGKCVLDVGFNLTNAPAR